MKVLRFVSWYVRVRFVVRKWLLHPRFIYGVGRTVQSNRPVMGRSSLDLVKFACNCLISSLSNSNDLSNFHFMSVPQLK